MATRSRLVDDVKDIINNIFTMFDNDFNLSLYRNYVSLEYFSLTIFESIFSQQFKNLNVIRNNSPFLDLISADFRIGVQVTFESPNQKKIEKTIKSFDKYNVDRIIVFFFSLSKTKLISNDKRVSVWTLLNVVDEANSNSKVAKNLYDNLLLWKDVNAFPSEFVTSLNGLAKDVADEIIKRRNENNDLFVLDKEEYKSICLFCAEDYARSCFEAYRDQLLSSPLFLFLCSLENDSNHYFKDWSKDTDFSLLDIEEIDKHQECLLNEYKNSEQCKAKKDYFQFANRRIRNICAKIIDLMSLFKSEIYAITRTAGQGKSVFCCNVVNSFFKLNQACVFIPSFLSSSDYPHAYFKNTINRVIPSSDYNKNLFYISSYLRKRNKTILVIVDGLNEYSDSSKAINDIGEIMKDLKAAGLIPKILVTSRNHVFDSIKGNLSAKTTNNFIYQQNVHFINNEEIWKKYFSYYGIKSDPNYTLTKLFNQNRLFIKIYCELYVKKIINDKVILKPNDIYEQYFEYRASIDVNDRLFPDKESFYFTLNMLANYMLRNKSFNGIPLSKFSLEDRRDMKKLSNDIYSVLSEKKSDLIKYNFDEFRDYVIATIIWKEDLAYLHDVWSSGSNFEGLFRMIVYNRTSNSDEVRRNDYSSFWYSVVVLNVMHRYGVDYFDSIDENGMIELFKRISFDNVDKYLDAVLSIVFLFLTPYHKHRDCFTPEKFVLDDDTVRIRISEMITCREKEFYSKLLNHLVEEDVCEEYLKELVVFLAYYFENIPGFYLNKIIAFFKSFYRVNNNQESNNSLRIIMRSKGYTDGQINFLLG